MKHHKPVCIVDCERYENRHRQTVGTSFRPTGNGQTSLTYSDSYGYRWSISRPVPSLDWEVLHTCLYAFVIRDISHNMLQGVRGKRSQTDILNSNYRVRFSGYAYHDPWRGVAKMRVTSVEGGCGWSFIYWN